MNADRLYYTDSYLREFKANVTRVDAGRTRVWLDETAFYPTSGGQPHDLGWINDIAIEDVADEGESVVHVLSRPLPECGETVDGAIDWERRYDHMQQHTGQHLLSAAIEQMLGIATLSFHMGGEVSTIDLATKELSEVQLDAVEDRVNEAAREPVTIGTSFEEANAVQGLRKPSERRGTLRIITIPGWDRSACGGTHVRHLTEVLPIQLRRTEKMRGNVRLEFTCGLRAMRRARKDLRNLAQLAKLAATPMDDAFDHFANLRQRLTEVEKERKRLENQVAEHEGRELHRATEPSADGIRRRCQRVDKISDSQRLTAQAFIAHTKAVLLIMSPDGVLAACSADSGLNAGALVKQAAAQHGGSGGGSATLAQGRLNNAAGERGLAVSAGFLDSML